jgi:hypothetical protein
MALARCNTYPIRRHAYVYGSAKCAREPTGENFEEAAGTREGPAASGARQGQRRRREKRGSGWRWRAVSGDAPDADIDRWEAKAATRTQAPRNGREGKGLKFRWVALLVHMGFGHTAPAAAVGPPTFNGG